MEIVLFFAGLYLVVLVAAYLASRGSRRTNTTTTNSFPRTPYRASFYTGPRVTPTPPTVVVQQNSGPDLLETIILAEALSNREPAIVEVPVYESTSEPQETFHGDGGGFGGGGASDSWDTPSDTGSDSFDSDFGGGSDFGGSDF